MPVTVSSNSTIDRVTGISSESLLEMLVTPMPNFFVT